MSNVARTKMAIEHYRDSLLVSAVRELTMACYINNVRKKFNLDFKYVMITFSDSWFRILKTRRNYE